uniref:Retrotransposon gag domain-containing protein n=1 Tax=Fagus sylvatica TaxID=28930 RepID=A0A2N9H8G2_FAGSY
MTEITLKAFSNAHLGVGAEISPPTKKIPGSIHSKRPSQSPSQHLGGDALPPKVPKRRGNRGELGAVWKALDQISSSPFSEEIERVKLPPRYTAPGFELFPSSLGEVALRWFNQIDRARYSETYNDIEGCREDVAVPTFKLGLPIDSGLRQSLTKRPPSSMRKLMFRIEQFIRLEEDKGNNSNVQTEAPVRPPNIKPSTQTNKIPRVTTVPSNFVAPSFKAHSTVFKEPIYRILEKIKAEPFFTWPPKLPSDPAVRSHRPMCSYHRERGHLTENCYKFKSHLEQLVSDGHLSEYVNPNLTKQEKVGQNNDLPGSSGIVPAGVIHVILSPLCTSISPASYRSDLRKAFHLRQSFGISDYAHLVPRLCSEAHGSSVNGTISFSDSDLHDVQLPHNDPLVITLRIGNYDVKRVLVDQGSFAEVGVNLSLPDRDELIILLQEFRDVFAWSVYEALGVSPDLACHSLAIPSDAKPVQQRHRKLAPERSEIIMEEVPEFYPVRKDNYAVRAFKWWDDGSADLARSVWAIPRFARSKLRDGPCDLGGGFPKVEGYCVRLVSRSTAKDIPLSTVEE